MLHLLYADFGTFRLRSDRPFKKGTIIHDILRHHFKGNFVFKKEVHRKLAINRLASRSSEIAKGVVRNMYMKGPVQ